MRTVAVSRRVPAPPTAVFHHLAPETIIEAEGTFSTVERVGEDDAIRVVGRGGGIEVVYRFVETDDGYEYEQEEGAGPFETMRTTVSVTAKDEGSLLTMESQVSLGLPLAGLTDRLAAWKRRGELRRALDSVAAAV